MMDIRQTKNYANYLSSLGWVVERIEKTNYFIRKFPLIGSILKIQRPEKINFDTIDKLCRKHRIFQVILEPNLGPNTVSEKNHSTRGRTFVNVHELMLSHGFRLSKSPYLPSKTLQIDLTQSQATILKNIKKDARYAIKRGSGLLIKTYSTPDEIKKWREAWKNSVKYNRYVPSVGQLLNLRKSFGSHGSLFLASHNMSGRIIGGVLFTISSHEISNYISYYWYGFTNKEGRTSLSQYSLLYQGILWAKKMGCKVFDFEGIYDPRFPNKSWLGFSHFKRSFGGYEVEYPGCYTKLRFPL
jgi:lipid II:glycine glycyltransferase (peptidoglycan interpeptide bridge formation enzyme)